MTRPEEYFNVDVLRYYDPRKCEPYEDGDSSTFSPLAAISSGIVWLSCFLSIFNGVKSSSWIVWFTVPVPFAFIFVMLFKGLTLDGSGEGIKQYIFGDEEAKAGIDTGKMWADAIGQIFFSIGVCLGILTSYGSYNGKKKPIIADAFIISLGNSLVSFVSGFAVWGIVGYLSKL